MRETTTARSQNTASQLPELQKYFAEMEKTILKMDLDKIDQAIDLLYQAWTGEHQVFIIGNGGSASTATHFTCDLTKTTIVEGKKRFKVISLVDNIPLVSALTNDEGFDKIFDEQLKALIKPKDVLIAISVHGGSGKGNAEAWSQNLLRAIALAKANDAGTIGLAGFDGGAMKEMTDVCMVIPCDSTPQVESFHLALEHLICQNLRQKVESADEGYLS